MLRTFAAVLLLGALAVPSGAAPVTDWKTIAKALDAIPTAAGISLKKRFAACKVIIHKDATWMDTRPVAWPDYAARPGDTVIKVVFDMPPPPQAPGPGPKSMPQTNVSAIWIVSRGKASPLSAWAQAFQNRPVPLGYDASNNC